MRYEITPAWEQSIEVLASRGLGNPDHPANSQVECVRDIPLWSGGFSVGVRRGKFWHFILDFSTEREARLYMAGVHQGMTWRPA